MSKRRSSKKQSKTGGIPRRKAMDENNVSNLDCCGDQGADGDFSTTELPQTGHEDAIDDGQQLTAAGSILATAKEVKDKRLSRRLKAISREASVIIAAMGIEEPGVDNPLNHSTVPLEEPAQDGSAIDDDQQGQTLELFGTEPPAPGRAGPEPRGASKRKAKGKRPGNFKKVGAGRKRVAGSSYYEFTTNDPESFKSLVEKTVGLLPEQIFGPGEALPENKEYILDEGKVGFWLYEDMVEDLKKLREEAAQQNVTMRKVRGSVNKKVGAGRKAESELQADLEYYGHGKGLFWDSRSQSWIYVDSQKHPEEWIETQKSAESGGDIRRYSESDASQEIPRDQEAIKNALAEPGKWFPPGRMANKKLASGWWKPLWFKYITAQKKANPRKASQWAQLGLSGADPVGHPDGAWRNFAIGEIKEAIPQWLAANDFAKVQLATQVANEILTTTPTSQQQPVDTTSPTGTLGQPQGNPAGVNVVSSKEASRRAWNSFKKELSRLASGGSHGSGEFEIRVADYGKVADLEIHTALMDGTLFPVSRVSFAWGGESKRQARVEVSDQAFLNEVRNVTISGKNAKKFAQKWVSCAERVAKATLSGK